MGTMHWCDRDALFLPDSGRWGRGYGGNEFTSQEMNETYGYILEAKRAGYTQPGYGPRLFATTPKFQLVGDLFLLPAGYDARRHPDRNGVDSLLLEPDNPTSLECTWEMPAYLQDYYRGCGWRCDQHWRPCNPHAEQLVDDERIGLNTNIGSSYEAGETVVVDVVVDDGNNVLFNTRMDLGRLIPSLVGGYTQYMDYGVSIAEWRVGNRPVSVEGIFAAAQRIVKLKTGVELPAGTEFEIVWGIRPTCSRHTFNFWTLVYTVHARLVRGISRFLVPDTDDVGVPKGVWHPKQTISSVVQELWPDHRRGYEATLR